MNVVINNANTNNVSLSQSCYNIEVTVTGVGNSQMSYDFSNSCYYGVYNNYINTPVNPDDPDCPNVAGSEDGRCPMTFSDGDIRYIFRPIELTDMFPDRSPRWNWTSSATLNKDGSDPYLGYNVNPSNTIKHIEGNGSNILKDSKKELDYEIIINSRGIAKIKNYNKSMGSYTNFDVDCTGSGARLCKSQFFKKDFFEKLTINANVGKNND